MTAIEQLAARVILETLQKGLAQGHSNEAWKTEPVDMHLQKAAKHAITASLMSGHGDYPNDPENALQHAKNCLCRAAMAVWVLSQ